MSAMPSGQLKASEVGGGLDTELAAESVGEMDQGGVGGSQHKLHSRHTCLEQREP